MKTTYRFIMIILLLLATGITGKINIANAQYASESLFTDQRARQVGDIVTILIVEYSSAKSQANSSTQKDTKRGVTVTGGSGANTYMPMFGIKGQFNNGFDNDSETSRKGSLTGKITATITDVTANGNFIINGEREVVVNGEKEKMTVSGVVRPQDITSQNTVLSVNIGDAKISYQGKGLVETGHKPGFLTRFLGWMF
ncbi:MAG TPA: flagellar basal body L-ring protein FlgH [bacterium]|nr:flagellar basal body L-ring protein FlgH [bacterium]HPN43213.1 flagellar basal body L-ring protein FlgH [bacterium]